ncbi:hypothetical protein ACIQKE_29245 [Streptomyces griseoviridis]|uniref:DUF3828 domain-containing protein n=1 Tax=Streptomyces hintoniae TaxID=3075521 RepID=A0ABU2UNX5_9ACTN|nr:MULTISPECIES: hypothetical protein [unclassified Streptomyces]MDH6699652.1 hypothetical protein [Streptomyces sp. MAA16]MDT0474915.1 hypothetical protein [Streptomyces sp. DSM 41014]
MNGKHRTARRTVLACALALGLGLGVVAEASAGAPRSVSGASSDNLTRIADFYGTYIDAVTDENSGGLPDGLRAHYLTTAFQKRLAAWESREHANGVLRAQDVPAAWKVTERGTSAAGTTEAVVTLTWGGGVTTEVVVDMNRDHRIFRIGDTV